MAERVQFGRHVLRLDLGQAHAVGLGPVQPVVGVVEFDPNVAHQPAARHVFAGMAGETGLQQVLRHVQGELLDHRPAADQVQAHQRRAQLGVAHAPVQLVTGNPVLARLAVDDQLLRPLRIASRLLQGARTVKELAHTRLPSLLVGNGLIAAKLLFLRPAVTYRRFCPRLGHRPWASTPAPGGWRLNGRGAPMARPWA